ncbi:hypothetical protein PVAP13_7NG143300 [Panicum virgatum]|uniref:F-box domain-containing protein n=1 Tax=Panicum virgatum TaxID=38727 RepID=A0A8T0PZR6_PANVG|nr:hypothetical protein PVAP13_7NG143300 [Panicum virgatum]
MTGHMDHGPVIGRVKERKKSVLPPSTHESLVFLPQLRNRSRPHGAAADWSKLPADILASVLCCFEFPGLFSSAAVCTSWRATTRNLRRRGRVYTRPQTPCLFYISPAGAELYSLAAGRSYRLPDLPDPPVADRYIWGSSHGWLVTADVRSDLHLLNPATGEQIGLLPVATTEHVTPVLDDAGELSRYNLSFYDATLPRKETCPPQPYEVGKFREVLYLKAVLSCDPSRGDCITMLIHNPKRQLSFARVGGQQWHWITTSPLYSQYSDYLYHNNAFYAMTRQGGIHHYTIEGSYASCDVVFKDTLPYIAYNIFTDTPCEGKEMHTDDSLGDDALFIGHSYTCCLSTRDYPKLLPGHVYFTDDDEYWLFEYKNIRRDVGIYNLEDDTSLDVVSSQPWLNWPNPIWITPSFTKINQ